MKKLFLLLLSLIMTFSIVGTPVSASNDKVTIGWAMAYFDHPVYQLLMKGAQELADELGDCELIFADGKNDANTQASQIDTFIGQGVDAIILTAAVSDPMLPSIKRINDAGIPLIIVDRRIYPYDQDVTWECYVTWDMVLSGTMGALQTIEALGGAGNAKGKVVVVEGTAGAGSTIDRGGAYYSKLAEEPGIEVIYKVDGDFDRAKGMEVTETILQRYPNKGDFNVIYYMNDEMALGGLQAIEDAGRLGEFTIISVDGEAEACAAVRDGKIDYEVMFKPDEQAVAVEIIYKIVKGEEVDYSKINYKGTPIEVTETDDGFTWVRPTCYMIDATNCEDPELQGW
jgi:ABC-type sugar transport system substrate-binding protein